MKLRALTLKAFKKHEELRLELKDGLVVFRGKSEAGKSSVLHALAYCLFGARALGTPVEGAVTYGLPTSALSVNVEFEINGNLVQVTRSPRGAELRSGDRLVTGQTEVTSVIQELLGAPWTLANALFFSEQGNIRGALASGSKATSSLIEQLADFAQIDRLIDLIQTNLPTGATKPYEERLAQAEATLLSIGEPVAPQDQTKILENRTSDVESAKIAALDAGKAQVAHLEKLQPVQQAKAELDKLMERGAWEADQQTLLEDQLNMVRMPAYDATEHERARQDVYALAELEQRAAQYERAHRAFVALPLVQSVWEGDGPTFIHFIEKLESDTQEMRNKLASAQIELGNLNRQVLEGQCSVCGLDYDSVPQVGERNNEVKRERDSLHAYIIGLGEQIKKFDQQRAAVRLIQQQWQVYRDFLAKYLDYVEVNADQVPPRLTWTAAPVTVDSADALRARLDAWEQKKIDLDRAQAKKAALVEQITALKEGAKGRLGKIASLRTKAEGLQELQAAQVELEEDAQQKSKLAEDLQRQLEVATAEYQQALALYAERTRTWEVASDAARKAQAQLSEVSANNVLLKKVRSARPAIIDKLWATLLSAVGHYFSQMRGTQSVVTRAEGAFLVDGQPIEGLSGSTLDILGLAIRVALLKTFLPNCSFLVLDEPGAACDDEREAALLGTIIAAQFDQVVIVTHSDVADAFANQLVTL